MARPASSLMLLAATLVGAASAASSGFPDYADYRGQPYTVTYDNRSFIVDGQRAVFSSFGLHYPRGTPAIWTDLFAKIKADNYNMIQTYVFWYAHQPNGPTDWAMDGGLNGAFNLTAFLFAARDAGLFVNLRIGPYICAETNFGGYPLWIRNVSGLVTRSSAPAWEATMGAFFDRVVNYTKGLGLWADQGGPIALAQVENELHSSDTAYIDFCGELAADSGAGVPWLMCNGVSANNTVNTCNGGSCTSFIEENGQNGRVLIDQPAGWTEDWIGWYSQWADSSPTTYDMDDSSEASGKAWGWLQWTARGGSMHNYYMGFGGTNYAHLEGSSTQPQYYTKGVLMPDGTENSVVREHFAALNGVLASIAAPLLNNPAQLHKQVNLSTFDAATGQWVVTGQVIAFLYNGTWPGDGSGVAFIENSGGTATVALGGANLTAAGHAATVVTLGPRGVPNATLFVSNDTPSAALTRTYTPTSNASFAWQAFTEPVFTPAAASSPAPAVTHPRFWKGSAAAGVTTLGAVTLAASGPLEQLSLTNDDSEVAVYATTLTPAQVAAIAAAGPGAGVNATLFAGSSTGIVLDVFIEGVKVGSLSDLSEGGGTRKLHASLPGTPFAAAAAAGRGLNLTIVSESLGTSKGSNVNNANGAFNTQAVKGLTGALTIAGVDVTRNAWSHRSGLVGEVVDAMAPEHPAAVPWAPLSGPAGSPLPTAPLTWLKTTFTAPPLSTLMRTSAAQPEVKASLQLDVTGLGRGHFFVNGWPVSRFWSKPCGSATSAPCQRYYLIPADLLLEGDGANELVLVDIEGAADVTAVRLAVAALVPPPPPPPCTAPVEPGAPVATFACATASNAGAAMTWQTVQPSAGPAGWQLFRLAGSNSASNLCLAAQGRNPYTNSTAVQLAQCDTTGASASQLWQLSTDTAGSLTNAASKHCADVASENYTFGRALDVWPCSGAANQEFTWSSVTGQLATAQGAKGCVGVCYPTS